jgi:hypothetical protein
MRRAKRAASGLRRWPCERLVVTTKPRGKASTRVYWSIGGALWLWQALDLRQVEREVTLIADSRVA